METLPPVLLLCIFTKCLSNNYGFEYFKKALTTTKSNLPVNQCMDFSLQVEHFFVASILNELGDKHAFDTLISCREINPLISLGVNHVVDDSGFMNAVTDRYLKKFKKKRKDSYNFNLYIERLYHDSVTKLISENIKILES